jgi:hypothetical protein
MVKAATVVPASTLLKVSKREKFIFMAVAHKKPRWKPLHFSQGRVNI